MKISVFGAGYVGLVTGACLADLGNSVICYDIDKNKIEKLQQGEIPFFEPGLSEIIRKNAKKNRIKFSSNVEESVSGAELIFLAVGTPSKKRGEANLLYVKKAVFEIAENLKRYTIIVNKSTVPVGTGSLVEKIIKKKHKGSFDIVSNPEFLREGSAIYDFMNPERIVIGSNRPKARKILNNLYRNFNCPIVNTDIRTAEMIKYASNAFLATKISFINEIANICEKVGANVDEVSYAMGLDSRIGNKFLNAGIGYGGSCFPKDVKALHNIALNNNYRFKLLKSVIKVNSEQKLLLVKKVESMLGNLRKRKICVWGLSFKPNTGDTRESAAIDIINFLLKKKALVSAYDPKVDYDEFCREFHKRISLYDNKYKAAENCDALIIVTEWEEFKKADLALIRKMLKKPNVIDGRNIYNPEKMKKNGFNYLSVGRRNKFINIDSHRI